MEKLWNRCSTSNRCTRSSEAFKSARNHVSHILRSDCLFPSVASILLPIKSTRLDRFPCPSLRHSNRASQQITRPPCDFRKRRSHMAIRPPRRRTCGRSVCPPPLEASPPPAKLQHLQPVLLSPCLDVP